jgi:hypothetical protein
MREFTSIDELKAHYIAVKKRLGGVSGPTGLLSPESRELIRRGGAPSKNNMIEIETPQNKFLKLLRDVAVKNCMDPKQIKEPSKLRNITRVRCELFYRAYTEENLTQYQIGKFAGVVHTTVSRGIKSYEKLLESERRSS